MHRLVDALKGKGSIVALINASEFVRTTYHPQAWKYRKLSRISKHVACQVTVCTENHVREKVSDPVDMNVYVQKTDGKDGSLYGQLIYQDEAQAQQAAQKYLKKSEWCCFHSIVSDVQPSGFPIPKYLVLVHKSTKPKFKVATFADYQLAGSDPADMKARSGKKVDYSIPRGWGLNYQLLHYNAPNPDRTKLTGYQIKPTISGISRATSLANSVNHSNLPSSQRYILVSSFFFPSADTVAWEQTHGDPSVLRATVPMRWDLAPNPARRIIKVDIHVFDRNPVTKAVHIQPLLQSKTIGMFTSKDWDCYFPSTQQWPVLSIDSDPDNPTKHKKEFKSCPPSHVLLARKVNQAFVPTIHVLSDTEAEMRTRWGNIPSQSRSHMHGTNSALSVPNAPFQLRPAPLPQPGPMRRPRQYTPTGLTVPKT